MSVRINGYNIRSIILKTKEAKTFKFTYDVAITTATFDFIVKNTTGDIIITKSNADFIKTDIALKIVKLILTVNDLDIPAGIYHIELKTTWDAIESVDKTETIRLDMEQSLFV